MDNLPEVAPTMFSYRELPRDAAEFRRIHSEMIDTLKQAGATWFRTTAVSPVYPNPPYPDGLYVEGWKVAPHLMPVLSKEAPFNFPLTRAAV